jgi:hypothetical protein
MLLFSISLVAAAGAAAPNTLPSKNCPRATSYFADRSRMYQPAPLAPRKLNQLPAGTTYMAVYRRIGGCETPLTMIEYKNPRRR